MSIPAEPSLLQNEVQILNPKLCKLLIGPVDDSVLRPDIADMSDHCSVIPLQLLEVWLCQLPSLTGMEHCALHTRAVYTRPRVLKEWWCEERIGSSFLNVLWLKVHSHLLLRACLLGSKRKLPPPACQVRPGLASVVCRPRGMQFLGTLYIYS